MSQTCSALHWAHVGPCKTVEDRDNLAPL